MMVPYQIPKIKINVNIDFNENLNMIINININMIIDIGLIVVSSVCNVNFSN